MSSPQEDLSLDDAARVWETLAEIIQAFVTAWDTEPDPPNLADFAPKEPAVLRRLGLVELVKVDLEYRWDTRRTDDSGDSTRRRVEQYIEEFPDLAGGGVSCDLLYEEYHVRKRSGDEVAPEEYFERFPDEADQLRRLLGLESEDRSMMLVAKLVGDDAEVGHQIDDFDLLARLGKGAFATVFLARQRSLQRLVALKISADHGSEPQTLAQLDHPHIVHVYDQRILEDRQERLLYMQYEAGGTVQEVIERARQLRPEERNGQTLLDAVERALVDRGESPAVESQAQERLQTADWPLTVCWLGLRLADALDYAHRRGVLHRDIKPANILLSRGAEPKLADFNISCCSKLDGANPAAYFGGSLAYMSPEQLEAYHPNYSREADSLDGRSDLYSLGIVLWELLTGRRPFEEDRLQSDWSATVDDMIERRRDGVPSVALDTLPSNCPPELKTVLLTCLAPDREERYRTGGDFAGQLRLCLQPEAQRLLGSTVENWKRFIRSHSLLVLLLVTLLPNVVAGIFNYVYNYQIIVDQLQNSREVFWYTQLVINGIAFPLGLLLVGVLFWPVSATVRQISLGRLPADTPSPEIRRRCLLLGQFAAIVGIVEWLIAGIGYPLAMHAAGVAMSATEYLHFLSSMTVCGLIAAAYPFFGVTFLCVRALFPALTRLGSMRSEEAVWFDRLHRITWLHLASAALVPMLGVMLLVAVGGDQNRFALGVLSGSGVLGFIVVVWLARAIQKDLATLSDAIFAS